MYFRFQPHILFFLFRLHDNQQWHPWIWRFLPLLFHAESPENVKGYKFFRIFSVLSVLLKMHVQRRRMSAGNFLNRYLLVKNVFWLKFVIYIHPQQTTRERFIFAEECLFSWNLWKSFPYWKPSKFVSVGIFVVPKYGRSNVANSFDLPNRR